MDLSYCPYDLLYHSNDGDRHKILNLILLALSCYDENIENDNFFDCVVRIDVNNNNNNINNINNNNLLIEDGDEILIYNGDKELVKIFLQKMYNLFRK